MIDEQDKSTRGLARHVLHGKLMAAVMKQLRSLEKPWSKLPARDQAAVLDEIRMDVGLAIFEAVDLIASDNRTRFRAKVDQVTFKDGVKAVLLMGNDEASHELADVAGGTVLVVIESPSRYVSETGMPVPEPDQRELTVN